MGSLSAATIDSAEDLHLIALYDQNTTGSIAGLTISQDASALDGVTSSLNSHGQVS